MPINIPGSSQPIRTQFLSDIELEASRQGVSDPPVQPGSTWYVLGTAVGNASLITTANIAIAERDGSVLWAVGDALDELRIANGLPELPAVGARGFGRLRVFGAASIQAGEQLVADKNGKRYRTIDPSSPSDGGEIELEAVDTGADTDLRSGEVLRWANTPPNVGSQVFVSRTVPITGGRDDEDDEDKRSRILERKRNPPLGGNWAHIVAEVETVAAVQGAYVYPALGGPASSKTVVTRDFVPEDDDYTRIPSDGIVRAARAAAQGIMPDGNSTIVQAVAEETTSVAIEVTIPSSSSAGGNGTGWSNATPWPPLDGGDTEVTVSAVTSSREITVDASTATSPVAGQTRVARWSPTAQEFQVRLVTSVAGSSGAWALTLERPFVDELGTEVGVGDYISPAAANITGYGVTFRTGMAKLGPGENTADPNRIGDGRSLRHPSVDDVDPSSVGGSLYRRMQQAHPEITEIGTSAVTTATPSVPASVQDAPFVLKLDNFGIYPA
jgi:hypothetical protein